MSETSKTITLGRILCHYFKTKKPFYLNDNNSKTGVDFILEQTEGNHGVVIKRFNEFGLAFDAMISAAELAKEDGDLLVIKGKTAFVYKTDGDVIRWDIFGRPEASE